VQLGAEELGNMKFGFKKSSTFLVAAIPVAIEMSKATRRYGNWDVPTGDPAEDKVNQHLLTGVTYVYTPISDSGDIRDLYKVSISEKVVPRGGAADSSGAPKVWFTGLVGSGFEAALQPRKTLYDGHGSNTTVPIGNPDPARSALSATARSIVGNGAGTQRVDQWFVFVDERTGMTDQASAPTVPQSGFLIVVTAGMGERMGARTRCWVTVQKTPQALRANAAAPGSMPDENDQAEKTVTFTTSGFPVAP
jgi:hypothetical protein